MQIPVLVKRVKGNGKRLLAVRSKIEARLKNGMELVGLEVGSQPHPLAEFAGMFKDDPMFEDWQKAIAEYRRKVDNDPDYL